MHIKALFLQATKLKTGIQRWDWASRVILSSHFKFQRGLASLGGLVLTLFSFSSESHLTCQERYDCEQQKGLLYFSRVYTTRLHNGRLLSNKIKKENQKDLTCVGTFKYRSKWKQKEKKSNKKLGHEWRQKTCTDRNETVFNTGKCGFLLNNNNNNNKNGCQK